jgi:hypothetical protein
MDETFWTLAAICPSDARLEEARRRVLGDDRLLRDCLAAARRERVLPQVVGHLLEGAPRVRPPVLCDAERYVAARRDWVRRLEEISGQVVAAIGVERCVVVKGLSVARLYPAGQWREFNDADLVLPDPDDLWSAVRVLRQLGFAIGKVRLALRADGHFHGIMPCRRPFEGKVGGYPVPGLGVDIHFGGFPCLDQGLLQLQAEDVRTELELGGVRCHVPTPEASILLLALHTIRQGYLRVRELNDLAVLSVLVPPTRWARLWSRAAAEGVDTTLRCLLALLPVSGEGRPAPWWTRLVARRLLDPGWPDRRVHGGRRLLWSRLLQVHHLACRARAQDGPVWAWLQALGALPPLLAYGRSYAIGGAARPVPLVPGGLPRVFAPIADTAAVDPAQLAVRARAQGVELQFVGRRALLCRPGQNGEVLAAPGCAFCRAGYFGNVDPDDLAAARCTLAALGVAGEQEACGRSGVGNTGATAGEGG